MPHAWMSRKLAEIYVENHPQAFTPSSIPPTRGLTPASGAGAYRAHVAAVLSIANLPRQACRRSPPRRRVWPPARSLFLILGRDYGLRRPTSGRVFNADIPGDPQNAMARFDPPVRPKQRSRGGVL